jgi:hypothetical protein
MIERNDALNAAESRKEIRAVIESPNTLPVDKPSGKVN